MAETEEVVESNEAIDARLQAAEAKRAAAGRNHDTQHRRAAEHRQRKHRVNYMLLRGAPGIPAGPPREPWTFRARPDLVKDIARLADELSAPRARVTIADVMEKGMLLAIQHYRHGAGSVLDWVQECCVLVDGPRTSLALAYCSYASWCTARGARALAPEEFGASLQQHFICSRMDGEHLVDVQLCAPESIARPSPEAGGGK